MFSISLKDTFIQFDTDRIEKYTVVEKGVFREYSLKWGFSDVQILDTGVRGDYPKVCVNLRTDVR